MCKKIQKRTHAPILVQKHNGAKICVKSHLNFLYFSLKQNGYKNFECDYWMDSVLFCVVFTNPRFCTYLQNWIKVTSDPICIHMLQFVCSNYQDTYLIEIFGLAWIYFTVGIPLTIFWPWFVLNMKTRWCTLKQLPKYLIIFATLIFKLAVHLTIVLKIFIDQCKL